MHIRFLMILIEILQNANLIILFNLLHLSGHKNAFHSQLIGIARRPTDVQQVTQPLSPVFLFTISCLSSDCLQIILGTAGMRDNLHNIRAEISKHTLTVRGTLFTLPILLLLLFSCKVISDCGLNFLQSPQAPSMKKSRKFQNSGNLDLCYQTLF